ncbi:MAG: TonB-dependent receptor [Tannerellaceae bacterium]|nr:TonB-dependent receptor [Tannerellaceae bacterium]
MKFVFVLVFFSLTSMSASVFSQGQTITLHTQGTTLQELFKEIEKQSDYRFFYNDELVNAENTVSMDVENLSIDEILSRSLATTQLKYKKVANNLIVISSTELLQNVTVSGTVVDAAGEPVIGVNVFVKGTTNGVITDMDGHFTLNVPDNNAVLVFSFIGYTTQEVKVGSQKNLRIILQEDNLMLDEVVVVAYGTVKKKDLTGSITSVDTKMLTAQSNSSVSRALEGAVPGLQVSAQEGQPGVDMKIRIRGLGSTNEQSSYALIVIDGVSIQADNVLTTINPDDIASMTVLKDAASTALYGSRGANGVVLITTKRGASGKAKITVNTRWGLNTMTNNMPDLVRDPAAIYEHMWLLNYNTYLYADGKPYQNNGYTNDVPLYKNDAARKQAAAEYASQHLFNYSGNSNSLARNDLGNWMLYSFPGWNAPSNYQSTGSPGTNSESATMLKNYLVGTDGKLNPDARLRYNDSFYDHLLKSRFRQEYNITASGGTDKVDYHVSMGYLQDPSYLSISQFDRYTGRSVVNAKVTDWFKLGANVSYSNRKTSGQSSRYSDEGINLRPGMGDASQNIFSIVNGEIPVLQLYARDENGDYIYDENGRKKVTVGNGDSWSPLGLTANDPWGNLGGDVLKRMELDKAIINSHDIAARVYADVKFLKDFTFTANVALDGNFSNITRYLNSETGGAATVGGALNKQNGSFINLNLQQLLNYNHDFGKHHVDAMAGHEFNRYSTEDMRFTSTHSLIPGFDAYNNFVGHYTGERVASSGVRFQQPGGNMSALALDSYLARANYIYDNKYYVSTSLRRDGSSKFKYPEDRWGTFWSVGGGWRITGEEFMKDAAKWLNNLKIRASYGVIGNQNGINTYGTYQTWNYGAIYQSATNGAGVPASYTISPGSVVNERLTWENVHTTDVGVDFDLFNRIHGTFEWYNRETVNAFYNNSLSYAAEAFAGTTSLTMDNAKIRNRGFEIDLNVDLIRSKNIYWSVGLNGTSFNTILTRIPFGQASEELDNQVMVNSEYLCYLRGEGKPYYNVYMYKYEGPDPNTGVPLYFHKVTQADHDAGFFTDEAVGAGIKTANYGRVISQDRVEFGDALPDWIGGFNTTFRYRNFDLSAVFSYQLGGLYHHREMIYYYESDFGRDRPMPIAADLIGNTWTPENPDAKFPIAVHNKGNAAAYGISVTNGPQQSTDLTLFGASYFNVKNITLGYSLPASILNRIGMSALRVYLSADNLYMLSEYKGIDPRMSLTGGNDVGQFTYPYLRVYNVGLNLEF